MLRDRSSGIRPLERRLARSRERYDQTSYVLPGGGVERGEIPLEAASRESFKELGVYVQIGDLVATVYLKGQDSWHYYYDAKAIGGTFGTGIGTEFCSHDAERGIYKPIWVSRHQLDARDIRQLVLALCVGLSLHPPLTIIEP